MAERYKVRIEVISQEGRCAQEHKVGDSWVVEGKTPEGICLSAYDALSSRLQVLMFSGALPWSADPDVARVACPDAKNPVVFELRRLRE